MDKILEFNNVDIFHVKHSFFKTEKKYILKNLNFHIKEGENLGIFGHSGIGKSTIAKTLMKIHENYSGEIKIYNKNIKEYKKDYYKLIQIVFQDPSTALNPDFSVFDAINEPLWNLYKTPKKQSIEIAKKLLKKLNLDEDILYTNVTKLSGGMAQRVCIARALSINPKIVILDEANSSLDIITQCEILEFLKSLNITFITISHDLGFLKKMSNEILYLS